MSVGKKVRLNRLFSHASGKLCSVAIDHFMAYQAGMPEGLRDLPAILKIMMSEKPDAMTMQIGPARTCWEPYAGQVPLIVQASAIRSDDTADEYIANPEDALRLGADALAVAAFVYGKTEAAHLRQVAEFVRQAEKWEIPVILHVYPRKYSSDGKVEISFAPEDIAWAVRCGIEVGVDVIKVPFTGDVASYGQIVRSCPVPMVAAGGPKTEKIIGGLEVAAGAIAAGAKGLTIGRNIWGTRQPAKALKAFKLVIHDGVAPAEALKRADFHE
jgi:fructose-bisphosphate aldolase, class I